LASARRPTSSVFRGTAPRPPGPGLNLVDFVARGSTRNRLDRLVVCAEEKSDAVSLPVVVARQFSHLSGGYEVRPNTDVDHFGIVGQLEGLDQGGDEALPFEEREAGRDLSEGLPVGQANACADVVAI
jgi:hypothetical protein